MRVGFNARLLRDPNLRGFNRYAVNLLAELSKLGIELTLYSDRPIHQSHLARLQPGTFQTAVSRPMRYVAWENRWLPRRLALDGADIFHTPFNFGIPWFCPCPSVLTLHDAIDQVYYGPRTAWREKFASGAIISRIHQWSARKRADYVITVSEHAKADLVRFLGLPAARVKAIHEAADARFAAPVSPETRATIRGRFALSRRYAFYVGGWERRKNLPLLLRGFAAANLNDVDLVLAGGRNDQRADLIRLARSLGIDDRLKLLGWIDDDDLPALYAEAMCFIYPSEYEGFGLQLCEAMAAGCPVIAAAATSLPEVLGAGGETFDPHDASALAELICRIADDHEYRDSMVSRARARSRDFSWEQTARETIAVYESALASSSRAASRSAAAHRARLIEPTKQLK